VRHHGPRINSVLPVDLNSVDEVIARGLDVLDPDSDLNFVVNRELTAVPDLEIRDDERNVETAPETLSPELGPGSLEVGHDGGVVDMVLGIDIPPSNLNRGFKRYVLHGVEGSRRPAGDVASTR